MESSTDWPSFLWVVRDFALQLKDLNDEPIKPKQYLERLLENQKVVQIN